MDLKEKRLSSKIVYQGKVIRIEEDTVLCPNNHVSTREVVRRVDAACIIPIMEDGRIMMEKQFRYPYNEVLYELPAGKQDYDEDIEVTARRELEEETGYYAHEMKYLGRIYPACGYSDEIIYLYEARKFEKTHLHRDEDEDLEIFLASIVDLKKMIKDGTIVDAKTICAISLYLLNKE